MSETIVNSFSERFLDLGYSPDEAAILQMRADLMADLRKFDKSQKANAGQGCGNPRR